MIVANQYVLQTESDKLVCLANRNINDNKITVSLAELGKKIDKRFLLTRIQSTEM